MNLYNSHLLRCANRKISRFQKSRIDCQLLGAPKCDIFTSACSFCTTATVSQPTIAKSRHALPKSAAQPTRRPVNYKFPELSSLSHDTYEAAVDVREKHVETEPDWQEQQDVPIEAATEIDDWDSWREGCRDRKNANNKVVGDLPLRDLSTSQIEQKLLRVTHTSGSRTQISSILSRLLYERDIQPNAQHYEALILANSATEFGSAENVRKLLQEAETENILVGQAVYTAALKVLAVHPDPQLVAEILNKCAARWIHLDCDMLDYMIVGYIRSGQFEMAEDEMKKIRENGKSVSLWIHAVALQELASRHDWEAVMRMCYDLHDQNMRQYNIPHSFWQKLLEDAVKADEPWTTEWIWQLWVERLWVRPSIHTVAAVVELANRHNLSLLVDSSTSLFRHLEAELTFSESTVTTHSGQTRDTYSKVGKQNSFPEEQRQHIWSSIRPIGQLRSPRFDPWSFLNREMTADIPWESRRYADQRRGEDIKTGLALLAKRGQETYNKSANQQSGSVGMITEHRTGEFSRSENLDDIIARDLDLYQQSIGFLRPAKREASPEQTTGLKVPVEHQNREGHKVKDEKQSDSLLIRRIKIK